MRARKFATQGVAISAAAAVLLSPLAFLAGGQALLWGLLGLSITAAIGIGGGAWLIRTHGRPDTNFLKAVTACMLARLFFGAAGALAATSIGDMAAYAYVVGLVAGYFPVQVLEMSWFWQHARVRS
jgi:hypothetical protein